MFNVIKMELHRLFRSKSLYITMGICAGCIALFVMLTAALMNFVSDPAAMNALTVSTSDAAEGITVSAADTSDIIGSTNPASFCTSFIGTLCVLFVVIFVAIFVHDFYKDGYSKTVMASVKNRWYFQAAKSVCVAVYTALILVVASVVSIVAAVITVKSFTFDYMGIFFQYLMGEFFLLNAIGLLSAFLTELTYSKVTSIVYILLSSTSIIKGLLSLIESKLSNIFHTNVEIWKILPSLYHGSFSLDAPDKAGNGEMLLYALVLSVVFIVIYNLAGACLITKRDVK